ncbi:MAG: hypothetical protein HY652_01035 [Acidobacteria bacterium]|nr:hypothetical protein [Acidobacteriota bacterium]
MISSRHVVLLLVALLGLEVVLFSPSSSMFFCGDSLFYLSRRLESQEDLIRIFTHDDDMRSYRPLTYVLFSYVWYPLFGLDPLGYHRVALLFHLLNTLLVFLLLKELLPVEGALAGSALFGLHSVNFFLTYDMTFLSDFSYLPLALLSLRAQLKSQAIPAGVFLALALLFKESAVVVPFLMVLCLLVQKRDLPWNQALRQSLSQTVPHLLLLGPYFMVQLLLRGGQLSPQDPQHPFHISLQLARLLSKYKFFLWALNLPEQWLRVKLVVWLIPWLMVPLLIAGGSRLLRDRDRRISAGLLWFLVALAPLLLLREVPLQHHLYLPMVGLALATGTLVRGPWSLQQQARGGVLLATFVLATALHVIRYMELSWVTQGSRVAKDSLRYVQERHPSLPKGATLHVLPSGEQNIAWYFDNGKLFSIFYRDPTLRMTFADRGEWLPVESWRDPRILVFRFANSRLYDVTPEWRDRESIKLLTLFERAQVDFDRTEVYPDYERFLTPTGRPAFSYLVARGDSLRDTLVTLAGATVKFPVEIPARAFLEVGVSLILSVGDGVVGQVLFHDSGSEHLLSEFRLDAGDPSAHRWRDFRLDLAPFAGRSGHLMFRCRSGPARHTQGDWLSWSLLRIRTY